jgi:hypothetical protein
MISEQDVNPETGLVVHKKTFARSNTVETQHIFGTPPPGIQRGTALRHESGEIFVVVGSIFALDHTMNPELTGVVLERTSDKKRAERPADVVRSQIEAGRLTYSYRHFDTRPNAVIEYKDGKRYLMTTD